MTAEQLDYYISNTKTSLDSIKFAIRHMRQTVDHAAAKLAKENAEWHDDPAAADHADFHAPADVQFPREIRDQVIKDFVEFYLSEMNIQEQAK